MGIATARPPSITSANNGHDAVDRNRLHFLEGSYGLKEGDEPVGPPSGSAERPSMH